MRDRGGLKRARKRPFCFSQFLLKDGRRSGGIRVLRATRCTTGALPLRAGMPPPRPAPVQGRTEHMSVKGPYVIGMRWLALTPCPSPASRERGDQNPAPGRSDTAEVVLDHIFCPPLNPFPPPQGAGVCWAALGGRACGSVVWARRRRALPAFPGGIPAPAHRGASSGCGARAMMRERAITSMTPDLMSPVCLWLTETHTVAAGSTFPWFADAAGDVGILVVDRLHHR